MEYFTIIFSNPAVFKETPLPKITSFASSRSIVPHINHKQNHVILTLYTQSYHQYQWHTRYSKLEFLIFRKISVFILHSELVDPSRHSEADRGLAKRELWLVRACHVIYETWFVDKSLKIKFKFKLKRKWAKRCSIAIYQLKSIGNYF